MWEWSGKVAPLKRLPSPKPQVMVWSTICTMLPCSSFCSKVGHPTIVRSPSQLASNFLHPAFMAWTLDFSAASRSFFNNPSSGTNEKERMVVKSMVNDAGLAFVNILKIRQAWEGCELVLFDAFNAGRGKMICSWVPHLHQIHLWNDDGVP